MECSVLGLMDPLRMDILTAFRTLDYWPFFELYTSIISTEFATWFTDRLFGSSNINWQTRQPCRAGVATRINHESITRKHNKKNQSRSWQQKKQRSISLSNLAAFDNLTSVVSCSGNFTCPSYIDRPFFHILFFERQRNWDHSSD